MKSWIAFTICSLLFFKSVNAQNQYFIGLLPALTHTEVFSTKAELNFLGASKITVTDKTYGEIFYPARTLEIYLQSQLNYHLSKNLTLAAGYGYQRNNPFTDFHTDEHRIVQQAVWLFGKEKLKIYQRYRSEQRFTSTVDGDRNVGLRFRYQAGLMVPLKNSRYFTFSEEVYFITTHPRNTLVPENWLYAGVGQKTKSIGNIEVGLVYNSIVFNTDQDVRNLILVLVAWSSTRHWKKSEGTHSAMRHLRQF